MNAHTPSISAIDPRGLPVRAVANFRQAAGEAITARVTQQVFDPAGRLIQQRDPRLFALSQNDASVPANLTTIYSLEGLALCTDSVDAGWQLGLPGAAGQTLESWDQRGWHRRTKHDWLLRPVAVHEQLLGEAERCAERLTWGAVSDEHARHNRCGQLTRQDDPSSSRLIADYGLSGTVLCEHRHFLDTFDPVDWPVVEADRENLLESGDAAQSLWTYAPSGEVLKQIDAKGYTQQFAYDRAGQLRSVGLQRSGLTRVDTLVSAIHYSALGQVEHELAGNGMRTTSAYDPANGRLMLLATQGPDQAFLQKLSYRYDPVGNVTEIADAALTIQHYANQRIEPVRRFTYDTLYQLTSATGWESARPSLGPALPEWQPYGPTDASRWSNYSETYSYDAAGNLLQRIHHGAVGDTLSMQVAALSNRSVKVRSGWVGVEESFDTRGNLLELQPGQRLQWNGRNQLAQITQVERENGVDDAERYAYDSEGTRLRKTHTTVAKSIVHTAEVRYLPGIELRSNSATREQLQVVSIQAGRCSVRLLHWDSPPPAGLENDQLRYSFDDHLGSSAFEVDALAQVISQEVYYPYGGTAWLAGRHEVETGYKTIRYSGKERDATGLYYYGARYYTPWLQRWLNPDPAGEVDGVNFYRFVRNNPINFVDEKGRRSIFAMMNDWLVERHLDEGVVIQQRGMKEIEKNSPELAESVFITVELVIEELEGVVAGLLSGVYDKNILVNYFGELTDEGVGHLVEGYKGMLAGAKNLQLKSEKIVAFSRVGAGSSAFVFANDRRKKIYINADVFRMDTVEDRLHKIVHEMTHLSDIFMSEDLWYLNMDLGGFYGGGGQAKLNIIDVDELQNIMVGSKSKNIIGGNMEVGNINPDFRPYFIMATGASDIDEAVRIFNVNPTLRTHMALNNADTLAAFVGAFNRSLNNKNYYM